MTYEEWEETHDYDHAVYDADIDLNKAFKKVYEAGAESKDGIIAELKHKLSVAKDAMKGVQEDVERLSKLGYVLGDKPINTNIGAWQQHREILTLMEIDSL